MMPHDEINGRVVFVGVGLFVLFALFLVFCGYVFSDSGDSNDGYISTVLWVFVIQAGIAGVAYAILRGRESHWREKMKSQWESDRKEFFANQESLIAELSANCPECETKATPDPNSGNRYSCTNCAHKFSGQEHDVIDEDAYRSRNPNKSEGPYPLSP